MKNTHINCRDVLSCLVQVVKRLSFQSDIGHKEMGLRFESQ